MDEKYTGTIRKNKIGKKTSRKNSGKIKFSLGSKKMRFLLSKEQKNQ